MSKPLPIADQLENAAIGRMMAARIPFVVWATDTTLEFTASTGGGLKALNLLPDELVGKSMFDYFRMNQEAATILRAHCRALSGEDVNLEFSHADRQYIVHIEPLRCDDAKDAKIIGCIGFAQDVTEQRRLIRELEDSEFRYRWLYESMQDAFVSVGMDGRIREFNEPYRELLGYEADELQSLTYIDLTPAKWHEFEARIVEQEILPKGFSRPYEKEYRRSDGTIVPVELRTFLITDDNGQPAGMWAIVRDITKRKEAERADRKMKAELERRVEERTAELERANWSLRREIQERMRIEDDLQREHEAIRRMLQAADHSRLVMTEAIHDRVIQVLLCGLMYLEAFEAMDDRSSPEAAEALAMGMQTLKRAANEAVRLRNETRTPVLDQFGLAAAIADCINHLSEAPGAPEILYNVQGRFDRLVPILENALFRIAQESLTNACVHSNSEKVRVTLKRDDSNLILRVEDDGCGFDADCVPEHCYGLNEIYELARVFGNGAIVNSEPQRGTCITATFPLIFREEP